MKSFSRLSMSAMGGFVVVMLACAGCAHVYKVQVDGAARPDAAVHASYALHEAALADIPAGDPAAVKYVQTALSAKGMFEAPNPETADLDVAYSYEIREQHRMREWDEPIYRTRAGERHRDSVIVGQDPGGGPIYVTVDHDDPPTQEQVGEVHHAENELVYTKELHLVATERKPATPDTPARVWDISIGYQDEDPNMDKAMPLLAAAGCDRIGTNTNGPIIVRLRDKDDVVAFIKRGL